MLATPRIGIFYYYRGELIVHDDYQKEIDPITLRITSSGRLYNPGEHRDLWDNYMTRRFPELVQLYDDNHKLLPRGRVGFYLRKGALCFLVTLDRCIEDKEDEIKRIFRLESYETEFSYGSLNYVCRECMGLENSSTQRLD